MLTHDDSIIRYPHNQISSTTTRSSLFLSPSGCVSKQLLLFLLHIYRSSVAINACQQYKGRFWSRKLGLLAIQSIIGMSYKAQSGTKGRILACKYLPLRGRQQSFENDNMQCWFEREKERRRKRSWNFASRYWKGEYLWWPMVKIDKFAAVLTYTVYFT